MQVEHGLSEISVVAKHLLHGSRLDCRASLARLSVESSMSFLLLDAAIYKEGSLSAKTC